MNGLLIKLILSESWANKNMDWRLLRWWWSRE